MTDPDKGAAPAPAPARMISLDPLAAFFRRKAEFMEREAVALALQLREPAMSPGAGPIDSDEDAG
jgi:hypothetical protein